MLGLSVEALIILALIAFNGLLAMSEIALVTSRRVRLQQAAEKGDAGAQAALKLAEDPTRFLSTVQVGITLVSVVAGAFGGVRIAARVAPWLEETGLGQGASGIIAYVSVIGLITYLSIVFGELVPKRIGLHAPERIAGLMVRPMRVLAWVGAPFVTLLSASTSTVLRLLGLKEAQDTNLSEEELRLMIGMSAETGTVATEEAELLDRVFHFGDRRVHEVMIARTEAVWMEKDWTLRDFFGVYAEAPHSRFPVYDDTPDVVVGILGIKDVLAALAIDKVNDDSAIESLVRPAYFVPESKLIGELFREMQAKGVQMAIAVDEFGGTAGIVTMEQLVEEMVGPMGDELRPQEAEIRNIDARTNLVDGSLSVEEAREELGLDIPEGPYDTIAGFVLDRLGHIPQEGEQLPIDDHRIIVAEMRGPKIELLRVTRAG